MYMRPLFVSAPGKTVLLAVCAAMRSAALGDSVPDSRVRTIVDPVRVVASNVDGADVLCAPRFGQVPEGRFLDGSGVPRWFRLTGDRRAGQSFDGTRYRRCPGAYVDLSCGEGAFATAVCGGYGRHPGRCGADDWH